MSGIDLFTFGWTNFWLEVDTSDYHSWQLHSNHYQLSNWWHQG